MRKILKEIVGVRTWITYSSFAKSVWISPVEDDLLTATERVIVEYWNLVDDFCAKLAAKKPGWRINGCGFGFKDDDIEEDVI